jgi:putative chitinase
MENISKLKGHVPELVLKQIPMIIEKYKINTPLRMAHFLGQCSHESGEFKVVVENLNYGAQGLANTWPNRFATNPKKKPFIPNDLANQIQKKPQAIANEVYSNRMGNGSKESNEGFKFRGRGYIQLTGKDNYSSFSKSLGEDVVKDPDRVSKEFPLVSAGWFFSKNSINVIADKGDTLEVITQVTRKINGGTIGLDHRVKEFKKYYDLLK